MVNFKIQENPPTFWDKEPLFIEEYNNGTTTKELISKLQLTNDAYCKLLHKCTADKTITPRRPPYNKKKHKPKNYHRNQYGTSFEIRKNNQYYASVKTVKQAKRMVELLKECDWDKKQVKTIKDKVMKEASLW